MVERERIRIESTEMEKMKKRAEKERKGGSGVEFKKVVVLVAEVSESVKCN